MRDLRIFVWVTALLSIIISFAGCDKPAPKLAYIQINKLTLNADEETQGTDSSALNTAWVYINDNPVGVFELPAKVPVTTLGDVKFTIIPGVKANGISSTRVQYTPCDNFITTLSLKEDSTVTVNPIVKYAPTSEFPYKENFEDPGLSVGPTSISGSGINIAKTSNPSEVFEGTGSGKIKMVSGQNFFEMATNSAIELPSNGTPVFLEMNFKSNSDIRIGIYAEGTSGEVQEQISGLNPTKNETTGAFEWRKVYILLTPTLQKYAGGTYKIYFGVLRNDASPEQIEVYFDNFKIVHP